MTGKIVYQFTATVWQYALPKGGWYFITLPKDISLEIREYFKTEEQGWGRLSVTAKTGETEWKTAIWFDTKSGAYLLPLKAEIRKKEHLEKDKTIHVILWI